MPYGHGSYTVHYDRESEALEVIESLNQAYVAGWNAALHAAEKRTVKWKQGLPEFRVKLR